MVTSPLRAYGDPSGPLLARGSRSLVNPSSVCVSRVVVVGGWGMTLLIDPSKILRPFFSRPGQLWLATTNILSPRFRGILWNTDKSTLTSTQDSYVLI